MKEFLTRLFAHVANPPTFKDCEPMENESECVKVEGTPFYVTSYSSKVKTIAGEVDAPHYSLAAETEDDWVVLFTSRYPAEVAKQAVVQYVEWRCNNTLDDMATDAMVADYEADKQALENAYGEGYDYFRGTANPSRDANPYPYGIDHYDRWVWGYNDAELTKPKP